MSKDQGKLSIPAIQMPADVREKLADDLFQRLKERLLTVEGFEKEVNRVLQLDPEFFPPSWMSYDVQRALDAIGDPHRRKKRLTVIRLAEADAAGIPISKVFDDDETCARPTWYGNRNWGQLAWREIPEIEYALDVCTRAAHHYYDEMEAARLALRRRQLNISQDRLAELAQIAVETLGVLMVAGDSDEVRRKAAVDTLTHAAPETAPKSADETVVRLQLDGKGPSMSDIRDKRRRRRRDGETIDGEAEVDRAGQLRSRRNGDEVDGGLGD